jgi:hypothetical protein
MLPVVFSFQHATLSLMACGTLNGFKLFRSRSASGNAGIVFRTAAFFAFIVRTAAFFAFIDFIDFIFFDMVKTDR